MRACVRLRVAAGQGPEGGGTKLTCKARRVPRMKQVMPLRTRPKHQTIARTRTRGGAVIIKSSPSERDPRAAHGRLP